MTSLSSAHESLAADPLAAATQRLIATVEALPDADWGTPSLLPGWTRAHVVAHLALNAEGLAGALLGVVEGQPVPMYRSVEARDEEIEQLAGTQPRPLRHRLAIATGRLDEALAALAAAPGQVMEASFERTPGGRVMAAAAVADMRLREVEIHHADLGLDYSPADWPRPFARELLTVGAQRHEQEVDALVVAADLPWQHQLGTGGPTVTGPAYELAWWLTGREPYPGASGLTSDSGVLPRIGAL